MIRAVGISAFLAIVLAMPMEEAAAHDPVGGAKVGGATGAIIGGVLGGGRGAAITATSARGGASATAPWRADAAATGPCRQARVPAGSTLLNALALTAAADPQFRAHPANPGDD
jgi:hypothetical protein